MSVTTPSPTLGLVAALSADSAVQALVGANAGQPFGFNVFDWELPVSVDNSMPTQCVVVRPHGGPPSPATLQLNYGRYQLVCYGQSPSLADQVHTACYRVLKALVSSVWASTYIHNCIEASGPLPGRDPTLQWPLNISTWLVKASDVHPPGTA